MPAVSFDSNTVVILDKTKDPRLLQWGFPLITSVKSYCALLQKHPIKTVLIHFSELTAEDCVYLYEADQFSSETITYFGIGEGGDHPDDIGISDLIGDDLAFRKVFTRNHNAGQIHYQLRLFTKRLAIEDGGMNARPDRKLQQKEYAIAATAPADGWFGHIQPAQAVMGSLIIASLLTLAFSVLVVTPPQTETAVQFQPDDFSPQIAREREQGKHRQNLAKAPSDAQKLETNVVQRQQQAQRIQQSPVVATPKPVLRVTAKTKPTPALPPVETKALAPVMAEGSGQRQQEAPIAKVAPQPRETKAALTKSRKQIRQLPSLPARNKALNSETTLSVASVMPKDLTKGTRPYSPPASPKSLTAQEQQKLVELSALAVTQIQQGVYLPAERKSALYYFQQIYAISGSSQTAKSIAANMTGNILENAREAIRVGDIAALEESLSQLQGVASHFNSLSLDFHQHKSFQRMVSRYHASIAKMAPQLSQAPDTRNQGRLVVRMTELQRLIATLCQSCQSLA
jgi:hypothetical protein